MKDGPGLGAFSEFITRDPRLKKTLAILDRASSTDATILILGETGVGKELLASLIHKASPRRDRPFVAVNCAAIPEHLVESELFGHEKGAFTDARERRDGMFKQAEGGTVLLDEIGDMPLAAQAKILRAMETKVIQPVGASRPMRVDVRIVAATNKDLQTVMRQGQFRPDLYYRLDEVTVEIPPLRERPADLEALSGILIEKLNAELGTRIKGISKTALAFLNRYPFPGNVRELKALLKRGAIMADGDTLWLEHLPIRFDLQVPVADSPSDGSMRLEDVERRHIEKVFRMSAGNKKRAADVLGIERATLYAKLKKYGIK